MSRLPSARENFTAKPRGSRQVSGEPRSLATVEKRMTRSVLGPGRDAVGLGEGADVVGDLEDTE